MGTFLSALRCTECSKSEKVGFLLPDRTSNGDIVWLCQACQEEVPDHTIEVFLKELEDKSVKLGLVVGCGVPTAPTDSWELLLEELQNKYLHPNHYMCMHIKRVLIHLYGSRGSKDGSKETSVNRILELCRNYLEVYSQVDDGYTTWRGKLLESMVGPYLQFYKKALANQQITQEEYNGHFKESLKMLKIAAKCRQFDPSDSSAFLALCLKEANDAL